jgi:hypothetical protein
VKARTIWLEQDAASDDLIVKQMEKIHLPEHVVKITKARLVAKKYVARYLCEAEEQTLSHDDGSQIPPDAASAAG